jgi:putative ABC transport system ATP-binding protein
MAITINQLEFYYSETPNHQVINIPSWDLADNEQVFIHGPSGCGKTTFLNLISGILPVSNGSIEMFGYSLQKMKSSQLDKLRANHIGCVFQSFNLIPYLSPIENIKLAAQFSKKNTSNDLISKLLYKLQLEKSTWFKPTHHLSMGQKQRVAIARALINNPKLIIVDEPTSSLDKKNRDTFIALLMEQVSQLNCALIFISHDLSLSRHFSRVDSFKDINQMANLVRC